MSPPCSAHQLLASAGPQPARSSQLASMAIIALAPAGRESEYRRAAASRSLDLGVEDKALAFEAESRLHAHGRTVAIRRLIRALVPRHSQIRSGSKPTME